MASPLDPHSRPYSCSSSSISTISRISAPVDGARAFFGQDILEMLMKSPLPAPAGLGPPVAPVAPVAPSTIPSVIPGSA